MWKIRRYEQLGKKISIGNNETRNLKGMIIYEIMMRHKASNEQKVKQNAVA